MIIEATESPDSQLLEHLRKQGHASIGGLTKHLGVTATAVRQRLQRLMAEGLIERFAERQGRGRPSHQYRLTEKGQRNAGDNYSDLAEALWDEIRGIEDPEIRRGLLKRVANRLAEVYADSDGELSEAPGDTLAEKMQYLKELMSERQIPFDIDDSGQLPVLTALACPYPELAQQDRSICAMERMMIAEVLGEPVKLSEYRLSGGSCCSFEPTQSET